MTHPDSPSISAELRLHTSEHHRRAERSAFQQDLLKGRVGSAEYAAWLGQLLWVYRGLESAWLRAGLDDVTAPALARAAWGRAAHLERDLDDLGGERPGPLPPTQDFVAWLDGLAAGNADALRGVVYVLEGSTNGSVYIARALRAALRLPAGSATSFLDPYGDAQRERWERFKADLDASAPASARPAMIDAAAATFDAMTAIGDGILRCRAVTSA